MRLGDAIHYYQQFGMLQFSKRILDRLGFQYFERSLIFVLADLDKLPIAPKKPYSFRLATIEDIEKETDYKDGWYTKEAALTRIREGRRLYILKDGDKIIYYLWAEPKDGTVAWFDLHFRLPPDIVYCTGSYTIPEYRNRGIAKRLDAEILHSLKMEGFRYIIGVVEPSNKASRAVNDKTGVIEYQTVHYKRYGHVRSFRIHDASSSRQKVFISAFRTPSAIWKVFWQTPDATRAGKG
jgi:ribosomal protein S18 acetylase RimI-like enzyme